MRPQHGMYMHHSSMGGGRSMNAQYGSMGGGGGVSGAGMAMQRPPNVQVGPEGMPMASQQEWRHMMMTQQQSMSFSGPGGSGMRPGFPGQGKIVEPSSTLKVYFKG